MQVKPTVAQQSASMRAWLEDRNPSWTFVGPAAAAYRAQLVSDATPDLVVARLERYRLAIHISTDQGPLSRGSNPVGGTLLHHS